MKTARAHAKLNLALVVGPRREDGLHEVATVLQRLDLADEISIEPAAELEVAGFAEDTLVRAALEALAETARPSSSWKATIRKEIPVAAGLAGGSSDAATALALANAALDDPLPTSALYEIACGLGADVPFFLTAGTQLGQGAGTALTALELPQDYWAVLVLPRGASKTSTAAVYAAFDERGGEEGWAERRARLDEALAQVAQSSDLAALPSNDLASSPLSADLLGLGAFRADVSGAGPVVYGLFDEQERATAAAQELRDHGQTWVTTTAWYR